MQWSLLMPSYPFPFETNCIRERQAIELHILRYLVEEVLSSVKNPWKNRKPLRPDRIPVETFKAVLRVSI